MMKNELALPAGEITAEKKRDCKRKGKVKEMLLRQIRYFIVVADTGNFSEAAAQCFITQSAISQQIKSLEDELNVKLFERMPRRVILTEAGRYLYEKGRLLLVEAEKLKTAVQAVGNKNDERLVITWITGSTPLMLENALCAFKRRFPQLPVFVYSTGYNEAFYDLGTWHTDIVLAGRKAPAGTGYECTYLYDAPCNVWITGENAVNTQDYLTADDLKDLSCIIVASDKERDTEQQYIRKFAGLDNINLYTQSTEEAVLLAAAGSGFYLTDNPDCPPGLKKIPYCKEGEPLTKSYYLYTADCNKYVQAFTDILSDLCSAPQSAAQNL